MSSPPLQLQQTERDKSSFTLKAAAAVTFSLFVVFIIVLSLSILREGRDAEQRAEDRAVTASQVVATNALWVSELSRQALSRIDDALGPDIKSKAGATGLLVQEAIGKLPGNAKAYVVAADGETLFSTDPNVKPIDIRDRKYFAALADGAYWYVSSLLVSRLNNSQIFVFSKRLERGGNFVGAAIISFDVLLLKDIWESLDLDEHSTVSFIRDDGQLVARYPLAKGPLDLSQYVLFTDYLPKEAIGSYPALSPEDGLTRIVGYRRVPGTNLVALASVSAESAYALFRRNTFLTLIFAVPTAAALAAAIIWILRLLQSDQRRRRALMEAVELNRMLVRDTHHRVKNNLQAIMSMVRMHELPDNLKADLQNRIAAMSAVHEHLYRLDRFAEVDVAKLIPELVDPLSKSFGRTVSIAYDIEPLMLDRDHATPFALLVSEVVTNALKHAFSGRNDAKVDIGLRHSGAQEITLTIRDNGIGFDAAQPSTGLGSRLIRAMLIQLGGTFLYNSGAGTTFEARFPTRNAA